MKAKFHFFYQFFTANIKLCLFHWATNFVFIFIRRNLFLWNIPIENYNHHQESYCFIHMHWYQWCINKFKIYKLNLL